MQPSLPKYVKAFEKIRVDKTHGIAPHKPILLLTILQMYCYGKLKSCEIYITPELVASFRSNWNLLVTTKHDCRISYPFYHLRSAKFWKLIPKSGFFNIDSVGSLVKSITNLDAAIECAVIDLDLYKLLIETDTNIILQQTLLNTFFPETKTNYPISSIEYQDKLMCDIENKILREPST